MNVDIITDQGFPHGSPGGFRGGCKGAHCPAEVACREVYRRYSGDITFRRLFDSGLTPKQIIAQEALRAAVDAAKRVPAPPVRPKKDRRAEANRARVYKHVVDRKKLRELLDEGFTDREIAERLTRDGQEVIRRQVTSARQVEGWAGNPDRKGPRVGLIDSRLHEVAHLPLEEAAKVLDRAPSYIRKRRQIAARNNQTPAPTGVS